MKIEQSPLFDDPDPDDDDDPDIEDLAAEPDDTVPADAAGAEQYTPVEIGFTGVCRGGPYDARTVTSRFPGGFLLFDKARALMWRYIPSIERPGEFVCLANGPVTLADFDTLRQVADGTELDVLAYDEDPGAT